MFKKKVNKIKPNPNLFKNTHVGRNTYKGLVHKDGTPFDDVDYFELLGRKCIELDKQNSNKRLPTDYGSYDLETVKMAKEICKGIDSGMNKKELTQYISQSIKIDNE